MTTAGRLRLHTLVLSVAALAGLAGMGCEAAATRADTPAGASAREVNREAAVASARRDAWLRYREIPVAEVGAQRLGGFWIVELRSPTGSGLRYAISTTDGTIRERKVFQ